MDSWVRTKKLVFCRGYNTLFQKFSRGLERAESLALAKHVTHCDPRQKKRKTRKFCIYRFYLMLCVLMKFPGFKPTEVLSTSSDGGYREPSPLEGLSGYNTEHLVVDHSV
jgi:hypothetical protein